MKKLVSVIFTIIAFFSSFVTNAQSVNERLANAMNNSNWFELDKIYHSAPKDSMDTFMEVFSRCLIGNRLNRPDVSILAFQELLNAHTSKLELGNLLNSASMFAMDLSRVGQNVTAASVITSIVDATKQYVDSTTTSAMQQMAAQYTALSKFTPYQISFSDSICGRIPFQVAPVGPTDKSAVLMQMDNSKINGHAAKIIFDTGAGVNIISDSLAVAYGLIPFDTKVKVMGISQQTGYYAIAKELVLGDITVRDVPFYVLKITSNNAKADQYIDCLELIVGSELMLQLKDVTLDFVNREIIVPVVAPLRSGKESNMCFSSSMNLLSKGSIIQQPMLMNIDTGDSSFGSLEVQFFDKNKEFITAQEEPDTIRQAGIGGTYSVQCYKPKNLSLSLGGSTVILPELTVKAEHTSNVRVLDYECNLGIWSLMLFDKVRFNLVDMALSTYPKTF